MHVAIGIATYIAKVNIKYIAIAEDCWAYGGMGIHIPYKWFYSLGSYFRIFRE